MTPFRTFRRDIKIKRRGGVEYDETGLAVTSVVKHFVIKASVQPASGNEITQQAGLIIANNDENRRNLEAYIVYTDAKLEVLDQSTGKMGDLLTINGKDFEITATRSWQNNVINHNAYIAQGVML